MISWQKLNKDDLDLINQICTRAAGMFPQIDKLSVNMDVSAVHISGCELNLKKLLEFDDFNFAHDIAGIRQHIERETGKLTNCFLPRCA